MDLTAKKALILGGSRGIGAAIVRAFAQAGAEVIFSYRGSADASASLAAETGTTTVKADSADRRALVDTVAASGPLDILVVNAGVGLGGDPRKLDQKAVDKIVEVNLMAPYIASVEAARTMRDGGRIILIGSNVADRSFTPGATPYAMSKAGLQGMVRGLARDLGPQRITVNLVQPGPVNTDMNPANGRFAKVLLPFMAIGRYLEPSEIAAFVTFLAGPHADMITGAVHTVDGGQNA